MISMRYDARQLAKIQKMLEELPRGSKSIIVPAINTYLMGGESGESVSGVGSGGGGGQFHGLKFYPVFKEWPGGQKYPKRTGTLQRGWETRGDLYRQTIYNDVPYAQWIHGNDTQTWRAKYGNWRTIKEIVSSNMKGAIRYATSKLGEWFRKKGWK